MASGLTEKLKKFAALAAIALSLALSAGAPAFAADSSSRFLGRSDTGSAAWTNSDVNMRGGPSTAYPFTEIMPGEVAVRVDRCVGAWCKVRGEYKTGWASRDQLSFGLRPGGFLSGPKLNYGRVGTVCFFEGKNYTGRSYCAGTGKKVTDLALYNIDNQIASVKVYGTSVDMCRDMNFSSYCSRINSDIPVLSQYLFRSTSSFYVH